MTYVVADTQKEGKKWAHGYLSHDEKYRVLSTVRQICGLTITTDEHVYITTTDANLLKYLAPALCGCRVTSCNEWITGEWKRKYCGKS